MRQVAFSSWREEKKGGASIYDKEVFAWSCVSCGCVFFSDLVLIMLLSYEMQRTIIMA
jgi:hypothetical protein